jgi:hypothetical protein
VTTYGTPEFIAYDASLNDLIDRARALDVSPTFSSEMSRLATLETAFQDRDYAVDHRHVAEAFAIDMEAALRAANAAAPCDERAVEKLAFLARRARAMVFARSGEQQ